MIPGVLAVGTDQGISLPWVAEDSEAMAVDERAELGPAVTLHAKGRVGPDRPQPVNGLEHGAPCQL